LNKILPTLEEKFKAFMDSFHNKSNSVPSQPVTTDIPTSRETEDTTQITSPTLLLEEITSGTNMPNPPPLPPRTSSYLTATVDDKIRSRIHAGEYVKLATLLSQHPSKPDNQNYNSVDKDGQLLFVRSMDRDQIKSITQWTKAFNIYVAIYTERHPTEIGNLMVYANIVQNIAEGCGEQAAFDYDEKFRRWRHHDPAACPWQHRILICTKKQWWRG
jgi:hypothetical protein